MRKAFDIGKESALSSEQFASLVNEMRRVDRDSAITPFRWLKQGDRYVCPEFEMKEVDGHNGYLRLAGDEIADRETQGALMMLNQFRQKQFDFAVQLMPPLANVYDEGRFVVALRDGFDVKLYGGNITSGGEVVEMATRLGEWSENPIANVSNREGFQERIRAHSFGFKNHDPNQIWEWLIDSMPSLTTALNKIRSGQVEADYGRLLASSEQVVDEVRGQLGKLKCVREVDLVRIGAYAERRLEQVSGYALALSSGCGVSNRQLEIYAMNSWRGGVYVDARFMPYRGFSILDYEFGKERRRFNYQRSKREKLMDSCGACSKSLYRNENGSLVRGLWLAAGDHCPHCKKEVPKGAVEC